MTEPLPGTIADLISRFPRAGTVTWIGVRPARRVDLLPLDTVGVTANGLVGDHRDRPGRRAVTLVQAEHLPVVAALCGLETVAPALLRRNIAVSGINLVALRDRTFRIGDVVLLGTGACAPCSRIEQILGRGGYNAMRGHGGITAEIVSAGTVSLGDPVVASDVA